MKLRLFGFLLVLGFMVNCSSPTKVAVFTSTTQHISHGLSGNILTSANIEKSGESCSQSFVIARFFYFGQKSSLDEAMKSAGITKVATIDRKSLNVLGDIYYKECIIVWGE